jgi:hypothetical protein
MVPVGVISICSYQLDFQAIPQINSFINVFLNSPLRKRFFPVNIPASFIDPSITSLLNRPGLALDKVFTLCYCSETLSLSEPNPTSDARASLVRDMYPVV